VSERKEKFVGYIDILGFTSMVEASEAGTGLPLDELLKLVALLDPSNSGQKYTETGKHICPHSAHIAKDLDFRITQVSDCVIVSAEISPAGMINLVHHCWIAVLGLLANGLLCRGYITCGLILHTTDNVIGTGYQRAIAGEKDVTAFKTEADERGTPYVEVDRLVCDYAKTHGDECTKKMFGRFTKDTGEGVALFPFKRLAIQFGIGGSFPPFNAQEQLDSNENVRKWIADLKKRVMAHANIKNSDAMRKIEHYMRALDEQLKVSDRMEGIIRELSERPIRP